MTRYVVEEADRELVIPLDEFVCSDVRSSWAPNVLILRRDDAVAEVSGLDEAGVRELAAQAARVVRAIATVDGVLCISFDRGGSIEVPSRWDFEAWEVRIRDGESDVLQMFATPGGGEPSYFLFDERKREDE